MALTRVIDSPGYCRTDKERPIPTVELYGAATIIKRKQPL